MSPACVLLALALACPRPLPPAEAGPSEDFDLVTQDGAVVHLHRHPADGPAVLLVHGIASNHRFWDYQPGRSLAAHLAARGFDAWCLDLRGHGDARDAPGGRWLHRTWDVDDYGLSDVPTALAAIRAATGRSRVAWVGHSMGGLVGALYASQAGDDALWALVAVASPVDFEDPDPVLRWTHAGFGLGGFLLPVLLTPTLARVATAWEGPLQARVGDYLTDPGAFDPAGRGAMLRTVSSPMWAGEMSQFARMMSAGSFSSRDGGTDYRAAMARIRVPALVIAGRADRVASPDRVRAYHDALGSPDRTFVVAARENGFVADYGHLDYGVGDHAEDEIFPLVTDFLAARAPR